MSLQITDSKLQLQQKPAGKKQRAPRNMRLHSLVLFILFLGTWQFAGHAFSIPKYVLPPLSDVLLALYTGLAKSPFTTDSFWYHAGVTLSEILVGFVVGSGIGLLLGMIISESKYLEYLLKPYITAFQSLPKVAVAPIIVMWFGYGLQSKIAIVILLTFFPVLITSLTGFKAVDTDRIDLLRSLSATRWQIFTKVRFPSALPYVFAGLDVAAVLAVVGAIVGEFVGAQAGLGMMILQMDAQLDTGGSFAIFTLLALMGILISGTLRIIRRRVLSWMPQTDARQRLSA